MIRCLLCRLWTAYEDADALPGWARRHLLHCPRCRAAHEARRRLEARLRAEAAHVWVEPPPLLEARIRRRLDRDAEEVARPGGLARFPAWVTAGVGVAVLAAATVTMAWLVPAWVQREDGRASGSAPTQTVASVSLPTPRLGPMPPGSMPNLPLAIEGPLKGELRLAMNDARTALYGLAESVVPEITVQALLQGR